MPNFTYLYNIFKKNKLTYVMFRINNTQGEMTVIVCKILSSLRNLRGVIHDFEIDSISFSYVPEMGPGVVKGKLKTRAWHSPFKKNYLLRSILFHHLLKISPNYEGNFYLFDGLESESVRFELVGEAGGLGVELVRHVPHAASELDSEKKNITR